MATKKKDLIIVESPAKINKIKNYAGSGYNVKASVGHFMELSDVDLKTFKAKYKVIKEKKKVLDDLKKAAKSANIIYIATDYDREGEAIGWHLYEQLKSVNTNFKRIIFTEITKSAIQKALQNPTALDYELIDAAKARQILDRVVGYKVSPLVWKNVKEAKSAGRVQSPTLRIIVDRQREIDSFVPEKYWTIDAKLKAKSGEVFTASYVSKGRMKDFDKVKKILKDIEGEKFIVDAVEQKARKRHPLPPLDTGTLQQTAGSALNWSAKKISALAQVLYQQGLITYIRTDSFAIAKDAMTMVRDHVGSNYDKKYLPSKPNYYKQKSSASKEQGAHECIRPTALGKVSIMDPDQKKLYDLINARFTACQMADAEFEATTIKIKANKHPFAANGNIITFDGFLKVWSKYSSTSENKLPTILAGEELEALEVKSIEHQTQPPPAYKEATLTKQLKDLGIGRPSTYASTVTLITSEDRNYAVKEKGGVLRPTEVGFSLIDFLSENFKKNFIEYNYTAALEEKLDKVANGEIEGIKILEDFWKELRQFISDTKVATAKQNTTDIDCPDCGQGKLIKKIGRYGEFYTCSEWKGKNKGCQFTAKIGENGEPVQVQKKVPKKSKYKCPDCSGALVIRKEDPVMLGCENFPKCKSGFFNEEGEKIEFKSSKRGKKKKKKKKK